MQKKKNWRIIIHFSENPYFILSLSYWLLCVLYKHSLLSYYFTTSKNWKEAVFPWFFYSEPSILWNNHEFRFLPLPSFIRTLLDCSFFFSFIPHPPIAFLSPICQIWKVRRLLFVAMQIDLSTSCCSKFIPWLFSFSPLWRCLWICDAKGSYLWSLQHPNANGFLPFCMVRLLGHSWTRSCWKCSFPLLSQVSLMMASSCP